MIDLKKLDALCEASSNSPWMAISKDDGENWVVCYVGRDCADAPWSVTTDGVRASELRGDAPADAAFIAAARQAVPELVAEVKRLRDKWDRVRGVEQMHIEQDIEQEADDAKT